MILRIPEGFQSDHRIQHRWEDRSQPVTSLAHPLSHPVLRELKCTLTPGFPRKMMQNLQTSVASEEEVWPRQQPALTFEAQETEFGPSGVQLVQMFFRWQLP